MAKNANDKAAKDQATEAPKRERKVLTDAERIAKLEADLKAAREKAEAKSRKQAEALIEKRTALVAKRDEIQAKIDELNKVIGDQVEVTVKSDENAA